MSNKDIVANITKADIKKMFREAILEMLEDDKGKNEIVKYLVDTKYEESGLGNKGMTIRLPAQSKEKKRATKKPKQKVITLNVSDEKIAKATRKAKAATKVSRAK